jgi:hypothetical protein
MTMRSIGGSPMLAVRSSRALVLASLLAAPALAGCLPLRDDPVPIRNTCQSTSDCGDGNVCADVDGTPTCIATKVDLPGLILEVRPPVSARFGTDTSYLAPPDGADVISQSPTGLLIDRDLFLSQIVLKSIHFHLDYDYKDCPTGPDGRLPADIRFRRVSPHAGLLDHDQDITAQLIKGSTDTYEATLPAGHYDIYVVPQLPKDCAAADPSKLPPPPALFFDKADLAQADELALHLVDPPRVIHGAITFPQNDVLTGWTAEVVEPRQGRLVSRSQTLEPAAPLSLVSSYSLEYRWDWGIDSPPVLRLQPPATDKERASIVFDLSALSPLNPSSKDIQADIDLSDFITQRREVKATVVDANKQPVPAAVTFRSKDLTGGVLNNAHVNVTVDTDPNGVFSTLLPPGHYEVTAYPLVADKAVTKAGVWTIDKSPDCLCGGGITVLDKSIVAGSVMLPTGAPLTFGTATVYPSPRPHRNYLYDTLLSDAAPASIDSTILDGAGTFSLHTASGSVDLLIAPPPGSLYPWVARSQVDVKANAPDAQSADFTDLQVPYPAVLRGTVFDPHGQIVDNAVVRAWLPVTADGGTAVIQIAETTTDDQGRYLMPVAPSISK